MPNLVYCFLWIECVHQRLHGHVEWIARMGKVIPEHFVRHFVRHFYQLIASASDTDGLGDDAVASSTVGVEGSAAGEGESS